VHILIGQPEFLGDDLTQYGQRALADLAFTSDNSGTAVVVDAHDRRAAVPVAEAAPTVDVDAAAETEAAMGLPFLSFLFPTYELGSLIYALPQLAARDL